MIQTTEIEIGHLATLHHQRAIKRLIVALDKLYEQGHIQLEALPETDLDPGNPESKCPDIILRDNVRSVVPVIIEIATNFGSRTDFKKMRNLIENTEYGIEEGFVFNFEKGSWLKFEKGSGEIVENPSFSSVLNFDLGRVL